MEYFLHKMYNKVIKDTKINKHNIYYGVRVIVIIIIINRHYPSTFLNILHLINRYIKIKKITF